MCGGRGGGKTGRDVVDLSEGCINSVVPREWPQPPTLDGVILVAIRTTDG